MTKNPLTFKHIAERQCRCRRADRRSVGDTSAATTPRSTTPARSGRPCSGSATRRSCATRATPRFTFAEARNRMRDYLVGRLKLTPNAPTLLEARDASSPPPSRTTRPTSRSLRGLRQARRRASARSPRTGSRARTAGVVESFVAGNDLAFVGARLDEVAPSCDDDGYLDNGETGRLTVTCATSGAAPSQHGRDGHLLEPQRLLRQRRHHRVPGFQPYGTVTPRSTST